MSLNIVILGPAHPFRGGGITTFNERLAKELQSEGHEVSILNFTVQYPSFLFPGKSQLTDEPAPEGIRIIRMLHSMNPLNWLKTGRYLRNKRPDLVIVRFWLPLMGPSFGTVLRQVRKNGHTKIIAIVDNVIPHEKRPGDTFFTRYFVKACDAFVVMSDKVKADLEQFTPGKTVVRAEHPVYDNFGTPIEKELAKVSLDILPGTKIVLFFGFIRRYKGLDLLLQAIPEVTVPGVKFLLAGEFYDDPADYYELINSLNIADQLIIHEQFIPNERVKYYFSAADVVIQPYRNATQSGVTPLAYHFEKPMIVTNVGGLPDYVPDGKVGLVVNPDPGSIAAGINKFFQADEQQFSPFILEEKKKYSWAAMVNVLIELYQKL
jgi:glycosyltransferase involved in cell wall biosynthesis